MRVLARKAIDLGLGHYPVSHLDSYLKCLGVVLVPSASPATFMHINRRDRHVAAAAKNQNAWLLSGDLALLAECELEGLEARCPRDVLLDCAIRDQASDALHLQLQVTPLSRRRGSLFARVFTGGWAGAVKQGIFTVLQVECVGRLVFDAGRGGWVFSSQMGKDVFVAANPKPDEPWILVASYDVERKALKLRAGLAGGACHSSASELVREISAESSGRTAFGHAITGLDYWNGHICRAVVSGELVSNETWRSVVRTPGLAPDPASGDILDSALERVRVAADSVRIPTLSEMAQLWL